MHQKMRQNRIKKCSFSVSLYTKTPRSVKRGANNKSQKIKGLENIPDPLCMI